MRFDYSSHFKTDIGWMYCAKWPLSKNKTLLNKCSCTGHWQVTGSRKSKLCNSKMHSPQNTANQFMSDETFIKSKVAKCLYLSGELSNFPKYISVCGRAKVWTSQLQITRRKFFPESRPPQAFYYPVTYLFLVVLTQDVLGVFICLRKLFLGNVQFSHSDMFKSDGTLQKY